MGFKKFDPTATDLDSAWVDCTPEENAAIIADIIATTPA